MLVSFVVPCYNEEESLPIFYKEACHVSDILRKEYQAEAEFIFIDDGSSDGTVKELQNCGRRMIVFGLSLSPVISVRKLACMLA